MSLLKTCVECGEVSESAHCEKHTPLSAPKIDRALRGYDYRWQQLSKRARRRQPFCSVCGTTEDLTTDHTEEAWERKAKGLPIRLQDVDVLCRRHNSEKGSARPSQTWGVGDRPGLLPPRAKAGSQLLQASTNPLEGGNRGSRA